jgi:palmitoyltransferase
LQLVLRNTTTVENLTRKTKVWQLAVLTPRPDSAGPLPSNTSKLAFLQVTYPQPNHHSEAAANGRPTMASPPPRTFAILKTRPGENPWDLGMYQNFKSVMGDRWWDWFLPIRYSPSCNHDRADSAFPLGTVVDRMRREAGLSPPDEAGSTASRPSHHHHRRHRHHSRHSDRKRREKRKAGQIESEKSKRRNNQ